MASAVPSFPGGPARSTSGDPPRQSQRQDACGDCAAGALVRGLAQFEAVDWERCLAVLAFDPLETKRHELIGIAADFVKDLPRDLERELNEAFAPASFINPYSADSRRRKPIWHDADLYAGAVAECRLLQLFVVIAAKDAAIQREGAACLPIIDESATVKSSSRTVQFGR